MMRMLENYAGPYPFNAYGSVVVDDPALNYALECGAMSVFPSTFIDEGVVAHELAHQWFGNSVTVKEWKDIWLAEGFATYFEFLYPDRTDPDSFDEQMRAIYAYLVRNEIPAPVISSPYDLFGAQVYYRGAVTLYSLQLKVGDKVFKDIIKTWYQTYRFKNASTIDFINVAVAVSGDDSVRPFLRDWLFRDRVPPLVGAPPRMSAATEAALAERGAALVAAHERGHRHKPLVATTN
jgi:aminopeptidase N